MWDPVVWMHVQSTNCTQVIIIRVKSYFPAVTPNISGYIHLSAVSHMLGVLSCFVS